MQAVSNKDLFIKGLRNGFPICLGYFAVSFTLGITARNAGMTGIQAMVMSMLCSASAGEYAGITVIAAMGTYLEMAVMEFVANARYLLMSCSLSQKFSPETKLIHRLAVGFVVTDEIFGVEIAEVGYLRPIYAYGLISVAWPGWAVGTLLGVIVGNILPGNLVSALSVGLYGMFIAIIIPPARKSRLIAVLVAISMASSFIFQRLTVFSGISSGMKTIILTVVIAGLAAIFFPIKEDSADESC